MSTTKRTTRTTRKAPKTLVPVQEAVTVREPEIPEPVIEVVAVPEPVPVREPEIEVVAEPVREPETVAVPETETETDEGGTTEEKTGRKKITMEELSGMLDGMMEGTVTKGEVMERLGKKKRETKTPEGFTGFRTAIMTLYGMCREKYPTEIKELYTKEGVTGPMEISTETMRRITESEYEGQWRSVMKGMMEKKFKREDKKGREEYLKSYRDEFMGTVMKMYSLDVGTIGHEGEMERIVEGLKKMEKKEKGQCCAKTEKGPRCKKGTKGEGKYCGIHEKGRKNGDWTEVVIVA